MQYVTEKELFAVCLRQEKKNRQEKGESLSAGSMSNRLYDYIIEARENAVLMKDGWKDFVKTL